MKQLLSILLIGISTAFGQLDDNDIILDSIDNISLKFIGDGEKVKFRTITIKEAEAAKIEAIRFVNTEVTISKNHLKLKSGFEEYTKQYVGYTDEKGNDFIYINGFCNVFEGFESLKQNLLIVFDGGNCYFQMKIDLKTGKCVDFRVNGVA